MASLQVQQHKPRDSKQKNNMASITQDINLDLLSLVTDVSSYVGWLDKIHVSKNRLRKIM